MTERGSNADYHLAQLNIARALGETDDPVMAEFMANLDDINALAEDSPGFVWRLQTDEGDATSVRAFDDPLMLLNLTVWADVESLHAYVYDSGHVEFLRRRREWFEPVAGLPVTVMWWIRAGSIPTVDEAVAKLHALAENGSTPNAFTFRDRFGPPDN